MKISNQLLRFSIIAALGFTWIATVNATTVVYTDKTAWESALTGPFLTEDFSDEELNTGVSFVATTPSGKINTAQGYYTDVLADNNPNDPSTTWSFSPGISAYGGDWTLAGGGGSGNSLNVYIDDFLVGSIPSSYTGGFWGFISDSPFPSVKLQGATGSNQQSYQLDNMVYSPVPVPAALWLFGSGLVGIIGVARRKKA